MGTDNRLLSGFGMRKIFNIFALIIIVICPFDLDEELLSMGSDLGARPGLDEVFNFFPVLPVEF